MWKACPQIRKQIITIPYLFRSSLSPLQMFLVLRLSILRPCSLFHGSASSSAVTVESVTLAALLEPSTLLTGEDSPRELSSFVEQVPSCFLEQLHSCPDPRVINPRYSWHNIGSLVLQSIYQLSSQLSAVVTALWLIAMLTLVVSSQLATWERPWCCPDFQTTIRPALTFLGTVLLRAHSIGPTAGSLQFLGIILLFLRS